MDELIKKSLGGRIVQSEFIEAERLEQIRIEAKQESLKFETFGGLPLAERQVVVIYPDHVPEVSDPTRTVFITFDHDLDALQDRLISFLSPTLFGDLESVKEGFLLVTLPKGIKLLTANGIDFRDPAPDELPKTKERTRSLVVPSLRVDVVGAKGFGTSRNYFAQGVKAGKVKLKGKIATGKDDVAEGDVLVAEGLGNLILKKVVGQTKKGNIKVELEVIR